MVSIAIIGVLSAIVTANFGTARAKSRDAKRVSDLAQLQLSLEFFFDRCNQYPPAPLDVTYECPPTGSGIKLSNYISAIPKPPAGGPGAGGAYSYGTNGSFTDYVIRAQLESSSSPLSDDIDPDFTDASNTAIPCGDAGLNYCVGPK